MNVSGLLSFMVFSGVMVAIDSLEDFLTNSRRCHGFYVGMLVPSLTMVDICFDSMARLLRQNICNLQVDDKMALNEEIPDRDVRVSQYIPVVLQHACRNWIFHLDVLEHRDGLQEPFAHDLLIKPFGALTVTRPRLHTKVPTRPCLILIPPCLCLSSEVPDLPLFPPEISAGIHRS